MLKYRGLIPRNWSMAALQMSTTPLQELSQSSNWCQALSERCACHTVSVSAQYAQNSGLGPCTPGPPPAISVQVLSIPATQRFLILLKSHWSVRQSTYAAHRSIHACRSDHMSIQTASRPPPNLTCTRGTVTLPPTKPPNPHKSRFYFYGLLRSLLIRTPRSASPHVHTRHTLVLLPQSLAPVSVPVMVFSRTVVCAHNLQPCQSR